MIGTNTPPLNQWREVCRWDVGDGSPTFAPHENEPTTTRETWLGTMWERTQADVTLLLSRCRDGEVLIDSLIACYEELAGEHRELWEAFMRDAEALSTPCPGDPEDYTFVRAYYRPRRSKLVTTEASPTGDKDIESGESQAKAGEDRDGTWTDGEGVPEAFIGVTLWECERCHRAVYRLDHDCIPQSPESADLIHQGLEDCAEGRVSPVDLGEERSE